MPAKNINKVYLSDSYYHIYNRGVNKEKIFRDEQDFEVFLGILKRYFDPKSRRENRATYPDYSDQLDILAYCLMPNHFHLFIYQKEPSGMTNLLKSTCVSYGMYFNKKYKRVGPIFQQRYKAVLIDNDAQLLHISRYIHLNPDDYYHWPWSSLPYYLGSKHSQWLRPDRVLALHEQMGSYRDFLDDYKRRRDELSALKDHLAG